MEHINQLISRTRTFRRFDSAHRLERKVLEQLIDLARLSGSARNSQPWQYLTVVEKTKCDAIFPFLGWAGYLSSWKGPSEAEQPTGYILCFLNKNWEKGPIQEAHFDLGIASQNILLGATALGLGGCRIGAFSKNLNSLFKLPENLELAHVIALGKPMEKVVIEDMKEGDIKYWRDEQETHHVPKRNLEDILLTEDIFQED